MKTAETQRHERNDYGAPIVPKAQRGLMVGILRASFVAFVVLLVAACARAPGTDEVIGTVSESATVAPPSIFPATASIPVGAGKQFTFRAVNPKGAASATWSVADPSIASISTTGFVVGLKPGVTTVTGVLNGTTTSHARLTVNNAKLVAVDVSPTKAAFNVGSKPHAFSANGIYSSGPAFPLLAATTTWASSDPVVASVSATGDVQANSVGVATISATDQTTGLSNGTIVTITGADVASVTIEPNANALPSIPAGLRTTLVATTVYSNGVRGGCTVSKKSGTTSCVTPSDIAWSVTDETVATVSDAGVLTALAPGVVTVTATYVPTGISGQRRLTVTDDRMTEIDVTTASTTLPIDGSTTLAAKAVGVYASGKTYALNDLSLAALTWSSNPESVATVAPDGTVTGVDAGTVVVTATDPISGLRGSVTLTVRREAVSALEITPTKVSLPVGTSQALTATAIYGTGKTATKGDATALAGWTSSNPSVALVSNATDEQGVVTALAAGTSTLRATFGGKSAAIVVTVNRNTLKSIAVTPQTKSLPLGATQALVATANYGGGVTRDITSLVTWSSSSPEVTVSNAPSSAGLASAIAPGVATITAVDPATGVAGTAWLTVSAAQLRSIAITPPLSSIPYGAKQQFAATGTFSDATVRDLTNQVLWGSTVPTIASISNASGSAGVATSNKVGSTIITALDPTTGLRAPQATLTITAATLTRLDVAPASATIANGFSQPFTAAGTYSDGTQKDRTSAVTWSVTAGSATISNAAGTEGLATSNGIGTSTIEAVEPVSGVSAQAMLTVTSARLVSLSITSQQAPSVPLGLPARFDALGTFTDKTTSDLTGSVSWTSSNPLVASVFPGGIVTTNGVGITTITATDTATGLHASTTLTVTAAVLGRIFVQAVTASFAPTTTWQLAATGDYTDGTLHDITSTLLWTSSNPALFSVSNAAGSVGLGTAIAEGSATISATDPGTGISGSSVLTIAAPRACVPGTFATAAYATGAGPYTLLTADMNGDGLPDLVSGDYSDGVRVLLGRPDGTFASAGEFPMGNYLLSIVIGDVDGDGIKDVVAPNYVVGTVTVGLGNGDGSLKPPKVSQGPENNLVMAELGDVDGDGKLDLAIGVNDPIGNLYIMKGHGDGTFAAAGPPQNLELDPFARPVASKFVDINGDGKLDLIVADEAELVLVLIGHGDGTFAPPVSYATANYPVALEVRDLNGDGKLDVVVGCYVSNVVSVLLGNGDGTFADHLDTPVGPWNDYNVVSIATGDFDGDGKVDVATGDGNTGEISILTGIGDGTFLAGFSFAGAHQVRGLASGDFNGDGRSDLAFADESLNEVFVLTNTCHR